MGVFSFILLLSSMILSSTLTGVIFMSFIYNPKMEKMSQMLQQQEQQIALLTKKASLITDQQHKILENTDLHNPTSYYILGGVCIIIIISLIFIFAKGDDSVNTMIDSNAKAAEHTVKASADVSVICTENTLESLNKIHTDIIRNPPLDINEEVMEFFRNMPRNGGGFDLF